MRWPVKNQILTWSLALLMLTIGAITFANIQTTIASNRLDEQQRIEKIGDLLANSRFPLTRSVLESMRSLSGAEFVVTAPHGLVMAQTSNAPNSLPPFTSPHASSPPTLDRQTLGTVFSTSDQTWFHSIVKIRQPRNNLSSIPHVHIFVPHKSDRETWWQASRSPLLIAAIVLPIAFLISLAMANRLTRPLSRLEDQVRQIADGDIHEIPAHARNDEIRDLGLTINEMAIKLQQHDHQLRQNEQLRTLVQLGSGIAHHLRNSATGCKMAVELLANENESIAESENLEVAKRQLGLMDNYIKKFLLLAKSTDEPATTAPQLLDLQKTLDQVIFLLRPSATHLGVELTVNSNSDQHVAKISTEDAEQLIINLVSNAIDAASEIRDTPSSRLDVHHPASVSVDLNSTPGGTIIFSVTDNGPGPPEKIASDLFQPFVTGKKEGTGLGLSLVDRIARRVGGKISWNRTDDKTKFVFEFKRDSTNESPCQEY